MEQKNIIKTIAILITPLLLFAVLLIPYSWLNSAVIVDIFGCGCPQVNEAGEIVHPTFNANDFTLLFASALPSTFLTPTGMAKADLYTLTQAEVSASVSVL